MMSLYEYSNEEQIKQKQCFSYYSKRLCPSKVKYILKKSQDCA